ncbi:FYB1 protein, partial [Pachycephala philippinensis]|nr:FYB1 protein [Pachycephala philippinensis]
MEKFEEGNRHTKDTSNSRPTKIPRQDVPKGIQARKAALEKLAVKGHAVCAPGPSTLHKPVQPKPPLGVKPSSDDKTEKDPNLPHLNPVAQRFGVQLQPTNRGNDEKTGCTKFSIKSNDPSKEDPKPLSAKPAWNKFLTPLDKEKNPLGPKPNLNFLPQESEAKLGFSHVAAVKEKLRSATQENEPKPSVSKPPLAQKPSLNNEVSQNEDVSNKSGFLQRLSGPGTNIHTLQETKEMGENSNSAAVAAGSPFPKTALKPTGHRSSLPKGTLEIVEENTEEEGMNPAKNIFLSKIIQEESGSSHKFRKTNTALAAGRSSGEPQEKEDEDKPSRMPKRKILPSAFKLGQPPEKPNRPPVVHLGKFQKIHQKKNPKNEGLKQKTPSSAELTAVPTLPSHSSMQLPPPPPASYPSLQVPAPPSLPPRNIKPSCETISPENEENYDDVEFLQRGFVSPILSWKCTFRPSKRKEKQDKKDKRRMDQEKKEQKEKEKKEHELRKKFKLTGPIEVLHQARACVDHKGGKNELTVQQGDKIEIIRLRDNPEGKWLGRINERYGYIKTTMVEIDYDSLKRKQKPSTRAAVKHTENDQETYDDVGEQDTTSSIKYNCINSLFDLLKDLFPPPPSDQDIYDGIDDEDAIARSVSQDEDKNGIWSWGILKRLKVKDDKKKSVREKAAKVNEAEENENLLHMHFHQNYQKACQCLRYVANFVLSVTSWFSSSKAGSFGKSKSDEKDVQKLKKMEKEEKEFRKKFKFDGEIKVLYSTTTVQDLSQKRWGYKDLQIKPGESLDVIESTDDTKVLCRNEEGK